MGGGLWGGEGIRGIILHTVTRVRGGFPWGGWANAYMETGSKAVGSELGPQSREHEGLWM